MNKILFKISKTKLFGFIISYLFGYLYFLLPIKAVINNKFLIAFYHPKKFCDIHILVVPKRPIKNLLSLDIDKNSLLLIQIFTSIQDIINKLNLQSYNIVVNGGIYQEVKQLHFHIFSGKCGGNMDTRIEKKIQIGDTLLKSDNIGIYKNALPRNEVDVLFILENVICNNFLSLTLNDKLISNSFVALFSEINIFLMESKLNGFSVRLIKEDFENLSRVCLHVTSGARIK